MPADEFALLKNVFGVEDAPAQPAADKPVTWDEAADIVADIRAARSAIERPTVPSEPAPEGISYATLTRDILRDKARRLGVPPAVAHLPPGCNPPGYRPPADGQLVATPTREGPFKLSVVIGGREIVIGYVERIEFHYNYSRLGLPPKSGDYKAVVPPDAPTIVGPISLSRRGLLLLEEALGMASGDRPAQDPYVV